MAIVFTCPRCDRKYSVAETMAGRRVTCKACGQEFGVPGVSAPSPSRLAFDDDDDDDIPMAAPKPSRSFDEDFDPPPRSVPNPPRVRPRAERPSRMSSRGDDSAALSPFVNALLFLVGGLAIVPPLIMAGYAVSEGDSTRATMMFWVAVMIGLFGMMIVYSLKILAVAIDEKGMLFGVFCLIVPLVSLIFIVIRWERTKSLVAGYLIGWGGLFVASFLFAANLPPEIAQRNAAGAAGRGGGGGGFVLPAFGGGGGGLAEVQQDEPMWQISEGVIVDASHLNDEAARELFRNKLEALARRDAKRIGVSTGVAGTPPPGVMRYQVEPVADPKLFAQLMIDFAKVDKVDKRKIYATADLLPEELATKRADVEQRMQREAVEKVKSDKQDEINRQFHEKSRADAAQSRKDDDIANTPPPLMSKVDPTAGPIDKALADTRTSDGFKAREALQRLAWGIPENRKLEIVKAVTPMLLVKDGFTANEAAKTLGAIKSPEAISALIGVLDRRDISSEVIKALGEIADIRAAKELANRLEKNWPDANKALIAIGPAAEPAVLEKLKDPASRVRSLALEVLAEIGGSETLKTMKTMRPDPDFPVKIQAGQTMEKIAARVGR